jgi:glutathionylspermidine synthase
MGAAEPDGYLALAAELCAGGVLSDPWLDGKPRFRARPIVLAAAVDAALRRAAEAVTAAYHEAALLLAADAALVERFYQLTPFQRVMWEASAPEWHGLARADVFLTAEGPKVCELNCDTPSGEAEAVLLNRAAHARAPELVDPNAELEARWCRLVELAAESLGRGAPLTVGIVYPTELVEDLSMIALFRGWLEARGHRVVLGAPFNLGRVRGRPALFDLPCDVFVRHYKSDWWGEREPAWRSDGPFADAAPLARQLALLLGGVVDGQCAVLNPFGAVLLQNKRTMALLWEAIDRLSPRAQAAIRAFVPATARLEAVLDEARAERAAWVLKSDYGCEGAEVVVGAAVDDTAWAEALAEAVPERWVAQRRFDPLVDEAGACINFGAYLVGGEFAGYFSRVHRGATGYDAVTAPTLVEGWS